MKLTAAVIVFKPGVSKEEAERLLRTITEPAKIDPSRIEVSTFDSRDGRPAFYIHQARGSDFS